MHELSVSSAVVDTALRHAAGRRVTTVDLKLGKLRQVVPASLSFYFEIVARDTLCEGASLDLELIDALMRCVECGHEWDPEPKPEHGPLEGAVGAGFLLPQFRCPECSAAGAEVVQGNELLVESIEVATSDPALPVVAGADGTGRRSRRIPSEVSTPTVQDLER